MVVGRLAAHTPSLFNVFSSVCVATTKGGAHCNNQHYMYKQGRCGRDRMVVGFTTIYAISAYHH